VARAFMSRPGRYRSMREIRGSELAAGDRGIGSLLRMVLLARRRRKIFRPTALQRTIMQIVCNRYFTCLHCPFELTQAIGKFFDVTEVVGQYALSELQTITTYPLLGPRFIGTLLNWQVVPTRLQLEHESSPASPVASHRIFFRRHSSHALDTFDLFLGAIEPSGVPYCPAIWSTEPCRPCMCEAWAWGSC
jgi:hypothetical protein